jgi:hypothetical protein
MIIFFPGLGASKKVVKYSYIDDKFVKNNFVDKLNKIDKVHIADIPYVNVHYYGYSKDMYEPINKLSLDDLDLFKITQKIYNQVKQYKEFTLVASSHGIYFACAFAYNYPQYVKNIISLDGSWITKELCKMRLDNWKKKGKIVKEIKTQTELDDIINNIKTQKDNSKYIQMIMDFVRLKHTNDCIKYNFAKLIDKINYIVFRDFNSNIDDIINKEFNTNAMNEHNLLINKKKYHIYWLVDGTHMIWEKDYYKKFILDTIKIKY